MWEESPGARVGRGVGHRDLGLCRRGRALSGLDLDVWVMGHAGDAVDWLECAWGVVCCGWSVFGAAAPTVVGIALWAARVCWRSIIVCSIATSDVAIVA